MSSPGTLGAEVSLLAAFEVAEIHHRQGLQVGCSAVVFGEDDSVQSSGGDFGCAGKLCFAFVEDLGDFSAKEFVLACLRFFCHEGVGGDVGAGVCTGEFFGPCGSFFGPSVRGIGVGGVEAVDLGAGCGELCGEVCVGVVVERVCQGGGEGVGEGGEGFAGVVVLGGRHGFCHCAYPCLVSAVRGLLVGTHIHIDILPTVADGACAQQMVGTFLLA